MPSPPSRTKKLKRKIIAEEREQTPRTVRSDQLAQKKGCTRPSLVSKLQIMHRPCRKKSYVSSNRNCSELSWLSCLPFWWYPIGPYPTWWTTGDGSRRWEEGTNDYQGEGVGSSHLLPVATLSALLGQLRRYRQHGLVVEGRPISD